MIQPNAQVCRRLAGASQECKPPPGPRESTGLGPSALPSLADRSSPTLYESLVVHCDSVSSTTTTIANYGTQAQVRAHVTFALVCVCVWLCARRCARAGASTTLRHVLSRQSVQLATNAFPRGQTGQPRSPLRASEVLTWLFLFFLIFLSSLLFALVSPSARPLPLSFLFGFFFSLPFFVHVPSSVPSGTFSCFAKITLCSRKIFR